MSERKVLNKYYPPDFDPSKIPRMKLAKNRQYTVRLMAPFNMRCVTCGEYIYKGKKFNARKEDVEGEDYLGVRIFRFYIKCTRCLQEISFRTDPKNTDYEIEAGATRNFMALKLAEEQAQKEEDDRIADEKTNPMKLLENRTEQSKQELDLIESLEELKDLNKRQRSIDYDEILSQYKPKTEKEQEVEDEEFIKSVFKKKAVPSADAILEEEIIEEDDAVPEPPSLKRAAPEAAGDQIPAKTSKTPQDDEDSQTLDRKPTTEQVEKVRSDPKKCDWNKSIGSLGSKKLGSLVKLKASTPVVVKTNMAKASASATAGALSLLGSYSDSDDGSENSS